MKNLQRHIDAFCNMMTQKGYDGYFLSNACYPGKIKESLQKHILECLQGSNPLPPFYLTTYTHWENEESPYVRCDFKVSYNGNDGFHIVKIDMDYKQFYDSIKKKDMLIDNNLTIPDRQQMNRMMMGTRRKMKI